MIKSYDKVIIISIHKFGLLYLFLTDKRNQHIGFYCSKNSEDALLECIKFGGRKFLDHKNDKGETCLDVHNFSDYFYYKMNEILELQDLYND